MRARVNSSLNNIRTGERLAAIAAKLMSAYLRLVCATARVERHGDGAFYQRAVRGEENFVYALWHSRLLISAPDAKAGLPIMGMVSRSQDGDLIAQALGPFGIEFVRGSSADHLKPNKDKGGAAALSAAARYLQNGTGRVIAITPDGPKGPRGRAKPGAVSIARKGRVPIVPVAYSQRFAIRLNSWDWFLFPLPFSKMVIVWGDALHVPDGLDKAGLIAFSAKVEAEIIAVTVRADRLACRKTVFYPSDEVA